MPQRGLLEIHSVILQAVIGLMSMLGVSMIMFIPSISERKLSASSSVDVLCQSQQDVREYKLILMMKGGLN